MLTIATATIRIVPRAGQLRWVLLLEEVLLHAIHASHPLINRVTDQLGKPSGTCNSLEHTTHNTPYCHADDCLLFMVSLNASRLVRDIIYYPLHIYIFAFNALRIPSEIFLLFPWKLYKEFTSNRYLQRNAARTPPRTTLTSIFVEVYRINIIISGMYFASDKLSQCKINDQWVASITIISSSNLLF